MSFNITLLGDINFSLLKGEPKNWIVRDSEFTLKKQLINFLKRKIGFKNVWDYRNDLITDILLEEYSGKKYNVPVPSFDLDHDPFIFVKEFLVNSDRVFANLESPFSSNFRPVGDFNSNPEYLKYLAEVNVNLVSIANNHMFDAGEKGFEETILNLKKNGIDYVGGGLNLKEAREFSILEKDGFKVGFLAYTDHCNRSFYSLARQNSSGILPLFNKMIEKDIVIAKKSCDFLVVYLHFGLENTTFIHKKEKTIAHFVVDSGADLVLGGHSHVPKGFELYKNVPIIYSLGNFIFPYDNPKWMDNILAQLCFENNKLQKILFYPVSYNERNFLYPFISNQRNALEKFNKVSVQLGMASLIHDFENDCLIYEK